MKPKRVYQPIRLAINGTAVSPGIFESLAALDTEESAARIEAALSRVRGLIGERLSSSSVGTLRRLSGARG